MYEKPVPGGISVSRFPKETNGIYVRNVMCLMEGAIRCGEIGLLFGDLRVCEAQVHRTKKAYGNALRFAGWVSFDPNDVIAFESKSVRLEEIIQRLQARCKSPQMQSHAG